MNCYIPVMAWYPDMQQLYFESSFPYLWESLGCLDLIGGICQTHCMVFRSRNLTNHCSDSYLRIIGIYRYISSMKHHMNFFFSPAFFTFSPQNALFRHNRFSTLSFSMKMTESGKIVLVSFIIDFKEVQVWLRVFSLNFNTYGVMMEFLIFSVQLLKKSIITP